MDAKLTTLEGMALSALRIVAGALFVCHGIQKAFGVFGMPHAVAPLSRLGLASLIEMVCGTLIGFGLFTRIAAFVASGEMAFAYFTGHAPRGRWPIQNGGELAVLYCFIFFFFVFRGAGSLSLDRVRGRR